LAGLTPTTKSILEAVFESGSTEEEQATALMAALQDACLQSIFKSVVTDLNLTSSEKLPQAQQSPVANLNAILHPEPSRHPTVLPYPRDLFPVIAARRNLNRHNVTTVEQLEMNSFEFKKDGASRKNASGKAAAMAKSRQVKKIIEAILDPKLSRPQQILAFHEAANHPRMRSTVKSAGFTSPTENSVTNYLLEQQKKMIQSAAETTKLRGRPTDDRRSFIEANILACADSPNAQQNTVPSKQSRIKALGLKRTSGYRLLKNMSKKRSDLHNDEYSVSWSTVKKRKGYSKVSPQLRKKLYEWFLNHPQVIASPIASDTLLLKDPDDPTKKIRVGKLLLQISYRELHNDLLSDGPSGLLEARHSTTNEPLISDTALRALTPPQVRTMTTRHKLMCGCETCIIVSQMQSSLNNYRSILLKRLEREASNFPERSRNRAGALARALFYKNEVLLNDKALHGKPKDALLAIQCEPIEGLSVPHFNCVIRTCHQCPKYQIPRAEQALTANDLPIAFHVYEKTSRCTMHGILPLSENCDACKEIPEGEKRGRFSRRKQITLFRRDLSTFIKDFYLPMLEKYAYHRPHFILLGKYETGADRKSALRPGDAETHRDYAERLLFEFTNEIMSEHFGNSRSLSMEGSTVRFFPAQLAEIYCEGMPAVLQDHTAMHFHSHFSDGSMQNAATTYFHMEVLVKYLLKEAVLKEGGYMFDNTDGCAKQYRCATALHLLSMLAVKYKIVIDRAICAPGHGKDLIDGLNAVDKMYLKELMMRTSQAGETEEDRKIKSHSVEEGAAISVAEEAARLCRIDARSEGAKSDRKYQKREEASTVKKRHYHVRVQNAKLHDRLRMKMVGWTTDITHGDLLAHYHLHADPDLGAGQVALRRIPCACDSCEEMKRKEWIPGVDSRNQPRFAQNQLCKYWPIFEGLNDWKIEKLEPKKDCDEADIVAARQEVLVGITSKIAESISEGGFGAVMTEDESTHGYYVVNWTSNPYTLQVDQDDGYSAGDLVCEANYLNPVGRARLWYTESEEVALVRLQHTVDGNLHLIGESNSCRLPRTCNVSWAREKGAKRIADLSHERILDEINRRDSLAFEEDSEEEGTDADDDEAAGSMSDEGDSEAESTTGD
jgi:hypothetical protein